MEMKNLPVVQMDVQVFFEVILSFIRQMDSYQFTVFPIAMLLPQKNLVFQPSLLLAVKCSFEECSKDSRL